MAVLILLQVSVSALTAHYEKEENLVPTHTLFHHVIFFFFANNKEIFVILSVFQKTVCLHLCVYACVYNTEAEIELSILIYRLITKG